jgi:hypothetical protein
MTLEFEQAVKALEEHIDILKQNLLFSMAERKPENRIYSNHRNKEIIEENHTGKNEVNSDLL